MNDADKNAEIPSININSDGINEDIIKKYQQNLKIENLKDTENSDSKSKTFHTVNSSVKKSLAHFYSLTK